MCLFSRFFAMSAPEEITAKKGLKWNFQFMKIETRIKLTDMEDARIKKSHRYIT